MPNPITDMDLMRDALKNSAAFRAWAGAATPADADAHIKYWVGGLEEADPIVVICQAPTWTRELVSIGGLYRTTPALEMEFQASVDVDDDTRDVFTDIVNAVAGIMADIEAQSPGGYGIAGWAFDQNTPERFPSSADPDGVTCVIVVDGVQRDTPESGT